MSRDDVIRMAREAGMAPVCGNPLLFSLSLPERFAAIVAAAEREACAAAVEALVHGNVTTCAAAIRARNNS